MREVIEKRNRVIRRAGTRPLLYDYFGSSEQDKPIVVFCHGYKGFKDWGPWDLMAREYAKNGFAFFKFNFSFNGGTVEEPIDFPDLEAFSENTFSKEMDDLGDFMDYLLHDEKCEEYGLGPEKFCLIGHSRGGGIAVLKAAEDARATHLVTMAGVSDFSSFFPPGEALDMWKEKGVTYVENVRTGQYLPHKYDFYLDFKAHHERLDIPAQAKELDQSWLITHGTADERIPVGAAKMMHAWNEKSELYIIDGADHSFGSAHPWEMESMPADLQAVVSKTLDFLQE